MKVNIFLLTILFCLILSYSCKNHNISIDEVNLKKETTIIQLSDSSYISDVRSLYFDGYLYLTDYNRDQIIILDNKGRFIKRLGIKGKGPGEFLGASHIILYKDTMYIANDSKRCFEVYDFNGYIKSIYLPQEIVLHSQFRFFIKENSLFLASPSDSNCVISMDINSYFIKYLGRKFKFNSIQQNLHRNKRHIYSYKDYFIALSDNIPVIEKYDFNGKLIEQYDYSIIPQVKKRLDFIKTKPEEDKGYYLLLNDAYLKNEVLYILLCTNENDKINSNKVLAINLSEDLMTIQAIYNLGSGWYSSICVADRYLWAFNVSEGGLIKFLI